MNRFMKCGLTVLMGICFIFGVTSCSFENDRYAVEPQNVLDYGFDTTEQTFFETFQSEKKNAQIQEDGTVHVYRLAETYEAEDQEGIIDIEFDSGKWQQAKFTFLFDGQNYLENAYSFLYAYDTKLEKSYGEPSDDQEEAFLDWAVDYESFLAGKADSEDGLLYWNVGDQYDVEDSKNISISITADAKEAMVVITIYPYMDRPFESDF